MITFMLVIPGPARLHRDGTRNRFDGVKNTDSGFGPSGRSGMTSREWWFRWIAEQRIPDSAWAARNDDKEKIGCVLGKNRIVLAPHIFPASSGRWRCITAHSTC